MNTIGNPFIQLDEVESSNNYAMAMVQARMAEHGNAWFAHSQTAGKGQRGKVWQMEPGANIILSVVIEPTTLKAHQAFLLAAVVALACHQFFVENVFDDVKIKWPNDIYWKDRKAGGILIENVFRGKEWKFAVVGIGLNINQVKFPYTVKNPVSMRQITGKTFDVVAMAKILCALLDNWYQKIVEEKFEEIINAYNSVLYKLNEQVTFKQDETLMRAIISGVDNNGALIINTPERNTITHGSWEWQL